MTARLEHGGRISKILGWVYLLLFLGVTLPSAVMDWQKGKYVELILVEVPLTGTFTAFIIMFCMGRSCERRRIAFVLLFGFGLFLFFVEWLIGIAGMVGDGRSMADLIAVSLLGWGWFVPAVWMSIAVMRRDAQGA